MDTHNRLEEFEAAVRDAYDTYSWALIHDATEEAGDVTEVSKVADVAYAAAKNAHKAAWVASCKAIKARAASDAARNAIKSRNDNAEFDAILAADRANEAASDALAASISSASAAKEATASAILAKDAYQTSRVSRSISSSDS